MVKQFRERLPPCDFYLEKCRRGTTAKVDVRIHTFVHIHTHTHAHHTYTHLQCTRALLSVLIHTEIYMQTYVHRGARSPYVGTRIEMEWDFSSIYSSCERIPTHIRCYLPFVPRRVKPLNGRLKRAIVWRASGINVKKRRIDGLARIVCNGM